MGQEGRDAEEVQDEIVGPPYAQLERTADNLRVGYGKALPRVVFALNDKVPPRAVQRTHLFS